MSITNAECWSEIVVHRAGPSDAIVIKPAGLSVELPEDARPSGAQRSLLAWARARWPERSPRLVHRLDRMARGIVLLALDAESAERHAAPLREGRWVKLYLTRIALLDGPPALGRHRVHLRTRGRRAEVVRSGGSPAQLEILRLAPRPALAARASPGVPQEMHALIRLETGRFHQIRATMAHLGAPVSGDPLYDPRSNWKDTRGFGATSQPDGARRWQAPYLEHALLVCPALGAGKEDPPEVIWRPDDPFREPMDAALLTHLSQLAADPPQWRASA